MSACTWTYAQHLQGIFLLLLLLTHAALLAHACMCARAHTHNTHLFQSYCSLFIERRWETPSKLLRISKPIPPSLLLVLLPALKQEGRESPRRNSALSAHLGPMDRGEGVWTCWKSSCGGQWGGGGLWRVGRLWECVKGGVEDVLRGVVLQKGREFCRCRPCTYFLACGSALSALRWWAGPSRCQHWSFINTHVFLPPLLESTSIAT